MSHQQQPSIREKSHHARKIAEKEAIKKTSPLVEATSKAVFITSSKQLARQTNTSKDIYCKNIERKYGKAAAQKAFKSW